MYIIIDLCLLCLKNDKNLKSIYSKDSDDVLIEKKLNYFLYEHVKLDPEVSKHVCLHCLQNINFFYNYRQQCLQNIDRLNSYMFTLKYPKAPNRHNLTLTLIDIKNLKLDSKTSENKIREPTTTDNRNLVSVSVKSYSSEEQTESENDSDEDYEETESEDNFDESQDDSLESNNSHQAKTQNVSMKFNKDISNVENNKIQEETAVTGAVEPMIVDDKLNPSLDEVIVKDEPKADFNIEMETLSVFDDESQNTYNSKDESHSEIAINSRDGSNSGAAFSSKDDTQTGTANNAANLLTWLRGSQKTDHRTIKCTFCPKTFRNNSDLRRHSVEHKPYICNICFKAFVKPTQLRTHTYGHIGEKLYSCTKCDEEFILSNDLDSHMKTHIEKLNPTFVQVPIAEEAKDCFYDETDITAELIVRSQNAYNSRNKSNEEVDNSKDDSQSSTANGAVYLLTEPPNSDPESKEDRPYKCTICSFGFNRHHNLVRHMKRHGPPEIVNHRPFKCTDCPKEFKEKQSLNKHILSVHTPQEKKPAEERRFKCTLCPKTFTSSTNLKRHIYLHTTNRPFTCDICYKLYSDEAALKRHKERHTCDKPFVCDICGKAFRVQNELIRHINVHTGDKPFKCEICSKAFARISCLKSHMRIHNNEKNFGCSMCPQKYMTKYDLDRHTMVHLVSIEPNPNTNA